MAVERYWDDAKVGDEGGDPDADGHRRDDRHVCRCLRRSHTIARRRRVRAQVALRRAGWRTACSAFPSPTVSSAGAEYRFLPGMSLGWNWDFLLPIKIGDTLHVKFRVGEMRASKSKPGWGIVIIPCELINQKGEVVHRGAHKADDPPAGPAPRRTDRGRGKNFGSPRPTATPTEHIHGIATPSARGPPRGRLHALPGRAVFEPLLSPDSARR